LRGGLKFIAAMEDSNDGATNYSGLGNRAQLSGYGEAVDVLEILGEVDFLNEEGRGFCDAAFGADEAAGVGIEVDFPFNEARDLATGL
jgi:hypothetical protein